MAVEYRDYYQTLGVKRDASQEEIQRAYRKLARQHHPDVNKNDPNAAKRFGEIGEAYEVLKDPEKRKKYDELGANWKAGQEFRPPPGHENVHFEFRGAPGRNGGGFSFTPGAGGFSDFFETFFGARQGGRGGPFGGFDVDENGGGARPGHDIETELTINLEEAFHGATRQIQLARPDGSQNGKPIEVKIPGGVSSGSKLRLRGQGHNGGDLLLTIRIAPHPRFQVEGQNLTTDLRIAPWEAALGAKVPVQTLDGEVTMTIPPGTSSGSRLRLRGRGLHFRKGGRGDLYVRPMIVAPKTLEDEEQKLYEKLKEVSRFNPREEE